MKFHFDLSEEERWVISPSLPTYLVSNMGRVRRIPFDGKMPKGGIKRYGGTPRIGAWDKVQKRYVLFADGKTYKIARLVCEAFNGPAPFTKAVVMHSDENSRNNRAENLKWGTQKENLNAEGFLKYCRNRTGENSPTAKSRK